MVTKFIKNWITPTALGLLLFVIVVIAEKRAKNDSEFHVIYDIEYCIDNPKILPKSLYYTIKHSIEQFSEGSVVTWTFTYKTKTINI